MKRFRGLSFSPAWAGVAGQAARARGAQVRTLLGWSGAAALAQLLGPTELRPSPCRPFTSAPQSTLPVLAWQSKGKRQECWESTERCNIKRIAEEEPPKVVVSGRGTSHATEMKVHEAVWLHQLLRSCFWRVLIDSPIKGLWGHTGSLCMLERAMPRMSVSSGHLYGE